MKCENVRKLLVAYLDGEVSRSESRLVQHHVTECQQCRAEVAALRETQNRVRSEFKAMLAEAAPSDRAWTQINTQIGDESMSSTKRVSKPKRRLAFVTVIVVLLAAGLTAFSKPVAAAVEELFNRLFYVEFAGGEGKMTFALDPLMPSSVPDRMFMDLIMTGESEEGPFVDLRYFNQQEFVVIYETPVQDDEMLPEGTAITVNDQQAVMIENLSGVVELVSDQPQPGRSTMTSGVAAVGGSVRDGEGQLNVPPERLDYIGAYRIVWVQNGTRIDLLSNLSYEETVAIAESMVPAKPVEE
jgi:hypothetical protein